MTDAEIRATLDDRRTLALTMWGEARSIPRHDPHDHSPLEELVAVGCVVRNRRARWSRWSAVDASYKAICLAPKQFSCWNDDGSSNHTVLMTLAARVAVRANDAYPIDPLVDECLYLADGVISGTLIDRTGGATSYWAPAAMVPPGRTPAWARRLIPWAIGDQLFVNNT